LTRKPTINRKPGCVLKDIKELLKILARLHQLV
jgi:hypothetical protein